MGRKIPGVELGQPSTLYCHRLIDPDLPEDLWFTRVGQHFIVFVEGFFFRHGHHYVHWRRLSNGDIRIVTFLHERMHQIERFREDFRLE